MRLRRTLAALAAVTVQPDHVRRSGRRGPRPVGRVGEFSTDWPAFMTMVVVFVLTQRHLVSGLLAGSVKS